MTNRIGTAETLPIDELTPYHENPRRGDVAAIAESLRVNGQYRPIVVNRGTHTGRPMEVLAGNHTLAAALSLDGSAHEIRELDCYVVDVDSDDAARIVLADNRTSDLGRYDEKSLLDLLQTMDDLDGTAYTDDDLDDLLAEIEEAEPTQTSLGGPLRDTAAPATANDNAEERGPALNEDTGVGESRGQTHAAPGYAAQPTRMIILHLPIDRFVWAQEQLGKYLAEKPELDSSNANAVIDLLERWSGEKAPSDEEAEE